MEFYREAEGWGDKAKKLLNVLFDSEASVSFIKRQIAQEIASIVPRQPAEEFELGKSGQFIKVDEVTILQVKIDGKRISDEFFVYADLPEDVIIGATTMQKWHIKLDFENNVITIGRDLTRLKLLKYST